MSTQQQSPHQLLLLADHLKLSLLERQRARSLNLEATKQDTQISDSLTTLHQGLEALEDSHSQDPDVAHVRSQYEDLYAQFHGSAPPPTSSSQLQRPNDPTLAPDFAAAQTRPPRHSKSVRFRDNPDEEGEEEEDAEDMANRTALFSSTDTSTQERYRDEPPDQSDLNNQQIHAYHTRVLADQDEALDTLGQSIGRQRMLGIQMGNELDEQNELLTDVEGGVDRHTTTLDRARNRLGHVARKSKDNWSWVTIGVLILILVLLIVVLN